jgi:hypothetical protein
MARFAMTKECQATSGLQVVRRIPSSVMPRVKQRVGTRFGTDFAVAVQEKLSNKTEKLGLTTDQKGSITEEVHSPRSMVDV